MVPSSPPRWGNSIDTDQNGCPDTCVEAGVGCATNEVVKKVSTVTDRTESACRSWRMYRDSDCGELDWDTFEADYFVDATDTISALRCLSGPARVRGNLRIRGGGGFALPFGDPVVVPNPEARAVPPPTMAPFRDSQG